MDRNDVDWKGYWAATPTPFTIDGQLDEENWRKGLQLCLNENVHGVLANGSTGEWFSQTDQERRRVAEIAVEELRGKIPIVIGCTSFTAKQAGELAQHALSIGADGIMSTPPPYCVPNARETVTYFEDLSDYVEIPIMVYAFPRGTNVEITRDIALDLAKIKNVVSLKDSTNKTLQMLDNLQVVADKLRIFSPFISRLGLAALRGLGGDGNIDSGAITARDGVAFYEAFWRNDDETAKKLADRHGAFLNQVFRSSDWSGIYGSPQPTVKAIMNIRGLPGGGYPRKPLLPIDDAESLAALKRTLQDAGYLDAKVKAA